MVIVEPTADVVVISFDDDLDSVVFVPGSADTILCVRAAWHSLRDGVVFGGAGNSGQVPQLNPSEAADSGPLREALVKIGAFFH